MAKQPLPFIILSLTYFQGLIIVMSNVDYFEDRLQLCAKRMPRSLSLYSIDYLIDDILLLIIYY